MSTLLAAASTYDHSFTPSHLYHRTTYPHLPPRPPQDSIPTENGRRRRAAAASRGQLSGLVAVEPSPNKSRKRAHDEDSIPTPRKERDPTATSSSRRGAATGSKSRKYVVTLEGFTNLL
jgi:hypothetical protein